MVFPEIARAGLEGFVPLIIVLVVVAKIAQAIKEASSGSGKSSSGSPDKARKIEQDLEKFFQSISDQNTAAEPPPPPIPAARKKPVPRARRVEAPPPPPMPRKAAARLPKAPVWGSDDYGVDASWGSDNYGIDAATPKGASCSYSSKEARREIIDMINDPDSIKKAVLLREILGPPVSMRH